MKNPTVPLLVLGLSTPAFADVIHVPGDRPTIQAAIESADHGDEIVVAPGRYVERIDFLGRAVAVRSVDPEDPTIVASTIIDGDGDGSVVRCVNGEDADTVLDGFTITNGTGTYVRTVCFFGCYDLFAGGGMYNAGSSPTVRNCTFTDNYPPEIPGGEVLIGGGMANFESSPTVSDCTFRLNLADFGGGMHNEASSPSIARCVFSENRARAAGGLYNTLGSVPVITDCVVSGNSALDAGGGMVSFRSNPTAVNCLFRGNVATTGGGAMNSNCEAPTYVNCTFTANVATDFGGAVANNTNGPEPVPTFTTMANCVLWGNVPDEIHEQGDAAASVSYSVVRGGWTGAGANNIDADPRFVDAGNERLAAGSPCIDAGDNEAVPDTVNADLDGDARFVDDPGANDTGRGTAPIVDMGAYERQRPACAPDLDESGDVDFGDVLLILRAWGNEGGREDLDGNGTVGFRDLVIVLEAWGACP